MELLILGLSTYSVTRLISEFDGPFYIFYRLRNSRIKFIQALTSCFYCLGVYVAIILYLTQQTGLEYVTQILAALGLAFIIKEIER